MSDINRMTNWQLPRVTRFCGYNGRNCCRLDPPQTLLRSSQASTEAGWLFKLALAK